MFKIKILGISGSPRDGNSVYLLKQALDSAKRFDPSIIETDTYSFKGKKFGPCVHCYACQDKLQGECAIEDDFKPLRDAWIQADAIIYSVPVYHMSIPGQLKCFIDRLGNSINSYYNHMYGEKGLMKSMKVIGSIAQGKHIFSGQEHALTDLINHTLLTGSIPVAGDLWEAYIGVGGWTANKRDKDSIKQLAEQGDLDASITVKACGDLGKRVSELSLMLIQGAIKNKDYFAKQTAYKPFMHKIMGLGL